MIVPNTLSWNTRIFSFHHLFWEGMPHISSYASHTHYKTIVSSFQSIDELLQDFLSSCSVSSFGAVFLMSVTMWIHLIHGDDGLHKLLHRCAQLTNRWLILEAQPWSCYRSAQRRLVRSGAPGFALFPSLTVRGPQVLTYMNKVLTEECGFRKVYESQPSGWNRIMSFYQKD